ncbi:maleylpyruvate isomerase N-terminal domain-containing protein [Yinghuangia sp. YIM S10712]|uniref:maleylpyruvate isomerase N-terminal domain-containing protein n=1 Tax=Yinghuangia sp. YIM S10712 TaxID=3436930 RepID=UPI003F53D61F
MVDSSGSARSLRTPISAADIEYAVALAIAAFRRAPEGADWHAPAGTLEWDCWETAEHLVDDLLQYASQLGPATPPTTMDTPYRYAALRPGGPANAVFVDRVKGAEGLFAALEATAGMLAALVSLRPTHVRAYHGYGIADPEGFAAMGVVETLVHAHDVASGLGTVFVPPSDLCARTLGRLFPEAPTDTDPWATLLWATGRADLPGRERVVGDWRWHSAPLESEV